MKKLILFLFAAGLSLSMIGQDTYQPDTIWGRHPNYFYDFWPPDDFWDPSPDSSNRHKLFIYEFNGVPSNFTKCTPDSLRGNQYLEHAPDYWLQKKHTDHPIKVIGLAIAQNRNCEPENFLYQDSVMIYDVNENGNRIRMWDHATGYEGEHVSHRLYFKSHYGACELECGYIEKYLPVYEYYLDEPIILDGDFYIGQTWRNQTSYHFYYMDDWTPLNCHLDAYLFMSQSPYDLRATSPCNTMQVEWWFNTFDHTSNWDCVGDYFLVAWPIVEAMDIDAESPDVPLQAKVYPNPASGQIRIEAGSPISHVRIHSLHGMIMYDHTHTSNLVSIATSAWPDGAYIVNFQIDGDPVIYTKKIIISK